jgi:hypothetical protein
VSWKRKTEVGAARLHRNFTTTKTKKKGKNGNPQENVWAEQKQKKRWKVNR